MLLLSGDRLKDGRARALQGTAALNQAVRLSQRGKAQRRGRRGRRPPQPMAVQKASTPSGTPQACRVPNGRLTLWLAELLSANAPEERELVPWTAVCYALSWLCAHCPPAN